MCGGCGEVLIGPGPSCPIAVMFPSASVVAMPSSAAVTRPPAAVVLRRRLSVATLLVVAEAIATKQTPRPTPASNNGPRIPEGKLPLNT